jgi:Xaa-Pro aminopeptidase
MNEQSLEKLQKTLQEQGLDAALLTSPFTITWLTGYAPPIQTGPSPFEGGPALGWWRDGKMTLILSDMEAGAASATGAEVVDYVSYTIDEPLGGTARQAAALRKALSEAASMDWRVGVEYNFLAAPLLAALQEALPRVSFKRVDGAFDLARAVKSPEEIDKLRAALKLCDLAQAEVRRLLQPGLSEIELWGAMKACLEVAAGGRLPLLADLAGGLRTADIGGLPTNYPLQPGDPLIADIVPRLDGYWGDNAATHFVGQPSPELGKIYQVVRQALRKGVEAVRPGLRASELDALVRAEIENAGYAPYPHHTGHGIGVSYHEEPRIVGYNSLPLDVGMALAIEPGIYVPGVGGVRLEDVVLVTQQGCEVLTTHLAGQ